MAENDEQRTSEQRGSPTTAGPVIKSPADSPPESRGPPVPVLSEGPGGVHVGRIGIMVLFVYLVALTGALLWGLVQLWPELTAASDAEQSVEPSIQLFGLLGISGQETIMLVAVALAGATGAMVRSLRSFYWYVGNRELVRSWVPLYLLSPFVGMTLAVVFYLVIRGGFFSPTAESTGAVSPLGFMAFASLVGMFSEQAVLKLKEVAETVFSKPAPGEDSKGQGDNDSQGRIEDSEG